MNAYKLWKPKPEVRVDYESDRPRHKASEAHHVSSSSRPKDVKQHHPSSRGYVSEGNTSIRPAQTRDSPTHLSTSRSHPHSSSTPKPTYSSSTIPYIRAPKQASSQQDVRTHTHRAANADSAPPSSHQVPVNEDHHKSTRHRVQPDGTSTHPNPQGVWLPPGSAGSSRKHRHQGQERDRGRETDKAKDPDRVREAERVKEMERAREMARVKAREDKRRQEQAREQAQRDQDLKEEIERRRRKEARRREKEAARREEERQRDQRIREEQLRLQPTPSRDSNKASKSTHDHRDASRQPAMAKDTRHRRVKDSDESDNSLRKPAASFRLRHHHREPSGAALATGLPPPSQQPLQAPAMATSQTSVPPSILEGATMSAPIKDAHPLPTSTHTGSLQPNERKHSKHLRTYQEVAPYPPGYAVSGSDSEHTARKDIRVKPRESSRHAQAANTTSTPLKPAGITAPHESSKSSHKHGKSTGGLTNWLFNRSDEKRERKLSDSRQCAPAPPGPGPSVPAVVPSVSRIDPSPVIGLKASEGPSEHTGHERTRKRTSSVPVPPTHVDMRRIPTSEQPSSATIPSHVQALMEAHAAAQPYSSSPERPSPQSRTPAPTIPPPQSAEHRPHGFLSSSFRVPSPAIPVPPRIHLVASQTDVYRPSPVPVDTYRPPTTAHSPAAGPPRPLPASSHTGLPSATTRPSPSVHADPSIHTTRQRSSPPSTTPNFHGMHGGKYDLYLASATGSLPYKAGTATAAPAATSRPVAPTLASSFPIHEDASEESPNSYNPYSYGNSRTRDGQHVASQVVDHRQMRSTKTPSPGQRLGPMPQVDSPPKNDPPPTLPLPYMNLLSPYDTSRQSPPSSIPYGATSAAYPDTIVYPSSTSRTHLDVTPTAAHPITAPNVPYNPNPRSGIGSPSPRSQTYPALSTHPQAAPAHTTHRTASYDTGSTTLLGQTPSSQASVLVTSNFPAVHPIGAGSSPSSRSNPVPPNNAQPTGRSSSIRHQPSASVPLAAGSSAASPLPPASKRSHSQPSGTVAPVSPVPVRSHAGGHGTEDPRVTVAGHPSTPAPIRVSPHRHMPSPDSDGLQTPSSLARSNLKLPIVSDPITPVMTSQSYQEPRKKNGFLGLFRSRSTSRQQNERILQPKAISGEGQGPPSTKHSSSKTSLPLQPDPEAKHYTPRRAAPTPATIPPSASSPPANPERKSGTTSFAPFRLLSKRHRTMSGASAEAVDGTNAGGSTVLTSPANSTRSPTPKLPPPQRDPVQATQDWRNKEEADMRGRGASRRRRPGVTFEGYAEDHPQAEQYKLSYVARMRSR